MFKIMFVCHGNICRSPMAEYIFRKLLSETVFSDQFIIASSATSDEEIWNGIGNPVYPPARAELAKHGIECDDKRAVQLTANDGDQYDLFVCMDRRNVMNTKRILGSNHSSKIRLLLSYTEHERDVSDPWYTRSFDISYTDIYDGCVALLNHLIKELNLNREKLLVSRTDVSSDGMTPDDVDYEMAQEKDPRKLEIYGMNQECLEYFAEHYGAEYEELSFYQSQFISDFSPLSKLKKLKRVHINWNIRADRLWNMSENTLLEEIRISDCKKMTAKLALLNTGRSLKRVAIYGSVLNNTPLSNLNCFDDLVHLEELTLGNIKLIDRNTDALSRLPSLHTFHFDAGMFFTEEIAYLCAKYPHLSGYSMGAYNTHEALQNEVRVCGFRKPILELPKDQKRLDKYIAEFHALVEKYKAELNT